MTLPISTGRSVRTMALASLISRGLGFVRAVALVAAIGGTSASVGGQAFDVAGAMPTNLYGLIAGGVLGAVLVPQVVSAFQDGAAGRERLDRLLTITISGAAITTFLITLAAPLLVLVYANGWAPEWLALATAMAYWCLPQIFFYIIYALMAQILNAHGVFGWPAWAPAIANFVSIIGFTIFMVALPSGLGGIESWTPTMIAVLCGTSTLSIVIQAVVLLRPLKAVGFVFRPRWGIGGLRKASKVALWTFLGVLAGQLAFVVISNVATRAGEALNIRGIDAPGLNSYGFAFLLVFVPHGVFTVSLATAMFTRMSLAAATGDLAAVRANISRTTAAVAFVCSIAMVILFVTGPLVTDIIWGTAVIGDVVRPLSLGLLGLSQTYVLSRGLFALHDGFSPFLAQVVAAVIGATCALLASWLSSAEHVVEWIAVGIAASNLVAWAVTFVALKRGTASSNSYSEPMSISSRLAVSIGIGALVATAVGLLALEMFGQTADSTTLQKLGMLTVVTLAMIGVFLGSAYLLDPRGIRNTLRVR